MHKSLFLAAVLIVTLACGLPPLGVATATSAPLPTTLPSQPPPPPAATDTPVPAGLPTAIPGWLTYTNAVLGYQFDYPPEAVITAVGVTGYPTDELPAGMTPDQYFALLERTYPAQLCVDVQLPIGFLTIGAPQERGGKYSSPCGVSGIGAYTIVNKTETIIVGGQAYAAGGMEIYDPQQNNAFKSEVYYFTLEDGTRFNYGGDWLRLGLTHDNYLPYREILLRMMASYRALGQ
jgi:hypothetical protein